MDIDQIIARQEMDLRSIAAALTSLEAFSTSLNEPTEEFPGHYLLIHQGDGDEEGPAELDLMLTFLPFDAEDFSATKFLQYYYEFEFEVEEARQLSLKGFLLEINPSLPFGAFGFKDGRPYYRFVQAVRTGATFEATHVQEILAVINFVIASYSGPIRQVGGIDSPEEGE